MTRFLTFLLMICGALSAMAQGIRPYYNPTGKEIPILAYSAFREELANETNYRLLRECGFNLAQQWAADTTIISKNLVLAEKVGVKVLVNCEQTRWAKEIPALTHRYDAYPATAGYLLWDEPNVSLFERMGSLISAIVESAPGKLAHVNLLPNYASPKQLGAKDYKDYLEKFVSIADPQFISYDNYGIYKKDGQLMLRQGYYENLEIARDVCNEHHLPLWTFCLSTAHYDYPVPTEGQLLFEAFSGFAYGSKAIQYFTYASKEIDGKEMFTSPVDKDGKRRKVWYAIKKANAQIQRVGQLLLPCKSVGVWHTGVELPKGTKSLKTSDLPGPFRRIVSSSAGVVVGHLSGEGRNYMLLVNKDFSNRQKVTVEIDHPVIRITESGQKLQTKTSKITLKAGGWALYSF